MATLDTHPFRVLMVQYAAHHGLAYEEGFDPGGTGPLGAPGREFLLRVQKHMVALEKKGRRVYPKVTTSGLLDEATREALLPDRPTWQEEFVRIARQDCANPNAAYYTQGPKRWQGVTAIYGKIKLQGPIPYLRSGDCSAGYTRWVLWGLQQSLGRVPHDVVNNCRWRAGYTGTIGATMHRVETPAIGDAALYGRSPFHHVTGVIDADKLLCASHGSNAGPVIERVHYRNDFAGFYRIRLEDA